MNTFDIARLAGVSRKTVQRVLNDAPHVSAKTKEKVLKIIEEHHYEPNETARMLSAKKTQTIGVFIVQDERMYKLYSDDLFYGAVIGAIISQSAKRGYKTLVTIVDLMNTDALLSLYKQKSIDGGLILSWSNVQETVDLITKLGYKVGVFDQNNAPHAALSVPIPHINNRQLAYKATNFLIDQGHKEIGMITGDERVLASLERLNGFYDAIKEHHLTVQEHHVFNGDFTEKGGEQAIRYWLSNDTLPEAVFCSNDLTAYGALTALNAADVRVPEHISIIGFDDLLISRYVQPPLTTMRIPRVEMAAALTDSLIDQLEGTTPSYHPQLLFEADIIIRDSVRKMEKD